MLFSGTLNEDPSELSQLFSSFPTVLCFLLHELFDHLESDWDANDGARESAITSFKVHRFLFRISGNILEVFRIPNLSKLRAR